MGLLGGVGARGWDKRSVCGGVAGWKKSVLEAEANLASSLLSFALLCLSWHVGL